MKILSGLFVLMSMVVLLIPHNALAAAGACTPQTPPNAVVVCAGLPCSRIGETTIDGNQQNVIACLYDNNGNMWWRAMSSSSASTEPGIGTYQMTCDSTAGNNCYVINTTTGAITGQSYMFHTFGSPSFTTTIAPGRTIAPNNIGKYQITCDALSGTNNCYVLNTIDGTIYGESAMFSTYVVGGATSFTTTIAPP